MSYHNDEINAAVDALGAVRLIRNHYASTHEGGKRITDICKTLETADENSNTVNGIRTNVAKAIKETYL